MGLFKEIYDLTYLPLLTPYNLIDNLKLENYISVKYNKKDNNIIAEIDCIIDDRVITFYYEFDAENNLKLIYYYENNNKEYLFDRETMLKELRETYNKSKKVKNL